MEIDKNDDEVVNLTKELVRIRSYSGEEKNISDFIFSYMKKCGFDDVFIDDYGSVIGCVDSGVDGKVLLMDGHIDTVRADDASEWKYPPFDGVIENGKMYGRGTSDMKGGVACLIRSAAFYTGENHKKFKGKIYVSCTVHEECFEGISSLAVAERVKPDFVIIGEASEGKIKIGQRGRAEIVVETYGLSCHSSNPDKGVNAVYHMMMLCDEINKIEKKHHEILGNTCIELTDIISYPYPGHSVVPSKSTATFDRRLIANEDSESIIEEIYEAISRCKKRSSDFNAKVYIREGEGVCWTGKNIKSKRFFPPWIVDENSYLVFSAKNGLLKAGLYKGLSSYSFCTNGSAYCGIKGIPCIGYGPSFENLAHIRDEYVDIEDLKLTEIGLINMIGEILL